MTRTDARAAMIDAAERLVAERGLAAMTLRDVQTEAGQANKSAAQYHFGSREGLLTAVVDSRMKPAGERRRELLDAIDLGPQPPTMRQLVEALILPLAEQTIEREHSLYARFLVQSIFDPAMSSTIREHMRAESFRDVRRRIESISLLPADIAELRTGTLSVLSVVTFATWEGRIHGPEESAPIVADLIECCLGALNAPAPAR
ncbi:TetR/AcrR family transcriptional regulator [Rhodococcus sp. IEGM 1379]|uniref:TetR/AcrR family transcriptional regulator n=1 Tax=Rhodococcus sp. IEGM 1379 TaxID=3047086 RepID=UPI0024B8755C|nr:TetR/AcrR family transcriptional regulator [Rhodococcus sp. IEGM 1379]MDI9916964.1 TetR family transcriptional regulator [Rhodococcus sp. IEGM 1379]